MLDPKKDETLRFCAVYCKRNAVTVQDSYPLRRMDDRTDCLGDAQVVSALEANSSYWQIEVNKAYREKKEFTSHPSLLKFTRTPFHLKTIPQHSNAMNIIIFIVKMAVFTGFSLRYCYLLQDFRRTHSSCFNGFERSK